MNGPGDNGGEREPSGPDEILVRFKLQFEEIVASQANVG